MRLTVWDTPGHGYPVDNHTLTQHATLNDFVASWKQSDVIAIHTGEELRNEIAIDDVVSQALSETSAKLLLFSGGGVRRPRQIAAQFEEQYPGRIHAMSATEFSRRVCQALADPQHQVLHLTAPARKALAVELLWALQLYQWQIESKAKEVGRTRSEAMDKARLLLEQPSPPEVPIALADELLRSKQVTSDKQQNFGNTEKRESLMLHDAVAMILNACLDEEEAEAFCRRLSILRDSLLLWAGEEAA
jgi:hypothetical protein